MTELLETALTSVMKNCVLAETFRKMVLNAMESQTVETAVMRKDAVCATRANVCAHFLPRMVAGLSVCHIKTGLEMISLRS